MKEWKVFLKSRPEHFVIIKAETRGKARWKFAKTYGYTHSFCKIQATRFN